MRPVQTNNGDQPEDLSLAAAEQLVAYDEAKAAGKRVAFNTPADSQLAGQVAGDLACVDLLHRVWPDFDSPPAVCNESPPPKILGDFRLIRELGRGGMGTVFEAEQISMGRHVALKVLPFAALVQDKSRQRFRNEVRAAAALDHPHIVSIYSVGEERGIHYYAMQLIRGQTLADMIHELRKDNPSPRPLTLGEGPGRGVSSDDAPTIDSAVARPPSTLRVEQAQLSTAVDSRQSAERYRTAARLGIQAAEALQHAHDLGVLHRDIKPSNLMLDAEGQLYITDFGLARIEADAGMTMTGDIVGTLRYMAPEQALAKRVVIDHRADIYSLGVTLYELLTLQPAYQDNDRQELLRQIAFEAPRRPREINPHIPVDLETIIGKASEKNPLDRYETAQVLADDLRRFLENKPIVARRPSLADRAGKWARRHVALAGIGAAALVIVTIACLAATLLTLRAYRSELRQRAAAEANLLIAGESVDQMLARVAGSRYARGDLTHAQPLATDATKFYERLLAQSDEPELRFHAAKAYHDVANIWLRLDLPERAETSVKRVGEIMDRLTRQFPERPEYLAELASNHRQFGDLKWQLGEYPLAIFPYRTAWEIWKELVDRYPYEPKYELGLADALSSLASSYSFLEQYDDAEECHRQIQAIYQDLPSEIAQRPENLSDRAGSLSNWAEVERKRKNYDHALRLVGEAIELQQRSLEAWPTNPAANEFYYIHQSGVVRINLSAGRHAAASAAVETVVATFPDRLQAYHEGASDLLRCAELARKEIFAGVSARDNRVDDFSEPLFVVGADERYRKRARELLAKARLASGRTPDTMVSLAWFLVSCDDKSFRDAKWAIELSKAVVKEVPERSGAWLTLALAHYRAGDWTSADEAILGLYKNVSKCECNPMDWLILSMIRSQQGRTEEAHELYEKARKWIDESNRDMPDLPGVKAMADLWNQLADEAQAQIVAFTGDDRSNPP